MAMIKIKSEAPPSPPPASPEYLSSLSSSLESEEGGGRTVTGEGLKLENHCLFCLQPQSLQILLEVDGKDPQLRKDFQPLMDYLTGTDPNQNQEGTRKVNEIWMEKVNHLPPMMCSACQDVLAELYRLHRELLRTQWLIQKQTELAREIVTKAGGQPGSSRRKTPKQLFYSKIQSSEMSAEEADAVTMFVEELHNKIVLEDSWKQKVIFPSSPLSYFVPEAGSGSKSTNSSSWLPLQLPNGSIRLSRCDMVNVSKSQEPVNASDDIAEADNVAGDGMEDDDNAIFVPSPSSEHAEDSDADGENPSEGDDAHSSHSISKSATVTNLKRKRKSDDDDYAPPPRMMISKSKDKPTSSKTARAPARPKAFTVQPLVETETGTSQHCDLCDDLFPSSEIQAHLESQHHVQDFISKCPNPACPCIYSCSGKLQKHLRQGTSKFKCLRAANLPTIPKARKCDHCRFRTLSIPAFHEHLLQKHERGLMEMDKEFPFPCPLPGCPHGFALRQTLEEHIFSHNPWEKEGGRKYRNLLKSEIPPRQECDLCGESILASTMVTHLEGHSPLLKEYITGCLNPTCLYVFSCVGKMERHLRGQRIIEDGGRVVRWSGSMTCRKAAKIPPGTPALKCDTCLEMVAGRTAFQDHLQQHENDRNQQEKNLTCPMPYCGERFALRQSVEEHLMSHDLRPQNQNPPQDVLEQECSVCKETIPVEGISEHLRESHEVTSPIPCRSCPLMFHNWESLLDHLAEHRLGIARLGMMCDMCGDENLKFRRYESLRQHYFNVHQVGSKLTCEDCQREFFSKERLSNHKEWSHPKGATAPAKPTQKIWTVKCDQCSDDSFRTKDTLLQHKIKVHGAPPIQCKFCDQDFVSVSSCRTHELTHLGLRTTFTCSVEGCGKVFKDRKTWKRHEKVAHIPDDCPKLFVCDTCGAGFNWEPSFKEHVRKHVKKELGEVKRHVCEICGESLASTTTLRKHKLIHSEEKRFSCQICGQPFRTRDVLRVHLKGHEEKGNNFKPTGPFKQIRKRV